nr:retrovirus-related Pol polyprotein from transposon TNT 1-94 [Tanacetum cinerariifolium]
MREVDVILSTKIQKNSNGYILTQSHYIEKTLKKFRHYDDRPVVTPFDLKVQVKRNKGQSVSQLQYTQVLGSLMYIINYTRPNLAYSVSRIGRYSHNPGRDHWDALVKISNHNEGKSISGYVFTLGGAAVSWKSSKQIVNTKSTMEAEFVTLDKATKEAKWIRSFLEGKDNGEMLIDSIKNGHFQLKEEITIPVTDGSAKIKHAQTLEDLTPKEKLRRSCDIKATNIILLGLPVDIYTLVNRKSQAMGTKCTAKKRVKDSEWLKEKMLLSQAQEFEVILNDEQQDFLADRLEDIDSDCEDLQLHTTSNFKADHVDAYDSDRDDEATASELLFEVPHYDTYHENDLLDYVVQEMEYNEHLVSNNGSCDELTSDSNVIFYADYMVTIENDVA